MSLSHISFENITTDSLEKLIEDNCPESKTLELKENLQLATKDQKIEFLSDVTALANSEGGEIIYGIKEQDGHAIELCGLRNFDRDSEVGKIENLLRDFINPRLSGHQIQVLDLMNGNHALVIRIPASFASPHMVSYQGITKFCGRNANGKYDLDVHELRNSFLASEGLSEKLRNFRLDRINKRTSGSYPVVLTSDHLMVLHILPVISARPDFKIDSKELFQAASEVNVRPIGSSGWGKTLNMDGLLIRASWQDKFHGYVQLFRQGYIEAVESQCLFPREGKNIIPSIAWEKYIMESLPGYLNTLSMLNVSPPYLIALSLINVKGYQMYVGPRFFNEPTPVDRNHLVTDEILIENPNQSPHILMRPLFDQIWNACGFIQSINYDENGNWRER